jgi:uncharacterized protein (DUF427 family)
MEASFLGTTIAQSNKIITVDTYHYFPPDTVDKYFLEKSDSTTFCPQKGTATYFDVVVMGQRVKDGAWTYATPEKKYKQIKGWIAFWKGVHVDESPNE